MAMTPLQIVLGLAVVSALLLAVEDRRLSIVPLLVQYVLVSLLLGPQFLRPITFVRIGLGIVICLTLHITARHVQRELKGLATLFSSEAPAWRAPLEPAWRAISLAGTGPAFRLMVVFLGGLLAYGVWRTYPLVDMPREINLAGYWLICLGLLMILTSMEPLRIGFGLLTMINGLESLYLFRERSLLVLGLLGIVDLIIALGIAICAESWLESLKEESAA